jgi:hypothetical protein
MQREGMKLEYPAHLNVQAEFQWLAGPAHSDFEFSVLSSPTGNIEFSFEFLC